MTPQMGRLGAADSPIFLFQHPARLPPVNSVGDAFGLAFRDPQWARKIAIQALILIVPIVGIIAMLGWMLKTMDNLGAGRQELAEPGFHLGRGVGLFLAELIYYLVLFVPTIALLAIGSVMSYAHAGSGLGLSLLGNLLNLIASVAIAAVLPALLVRVHRGGFAAAMDFGGVWALMSGDWSRTAIAALIVFAAGVIGSAGLIACFIGIIFTYAYAATIITGTAVWYGGSGAQIARAQ